MPPLEGRWLRLFVLLWILALPLATIGPVASSTLLYQRTSLLPFGFTILQDDTGVVLATVWGEEARAAGLRPGDRLATVGGHKVTYRSLRADLAVPDGASVAMGFERSGTPPANRVALPRANARAEALFSRAWLTQRVARIIEFLLTLLPGLFLVAAALILFRRRRETSAALMSLSFLLISATSLWLPTAWREFQLTTVAAALSDLGWSLLAVVLLTFPNGRFEPAWTKWAAAATIAWCAFAILADPPATIENLGYAALFVTAAVALARRYRLIASEQARRQIRWAFLGFAFGISSLVAAAILLALWTTLAAWDVRFVIWLPLICFFLVCCGIGIICAGLLIGLLRYRLYDADVVISRSAGYAVMTFLLALTFGAVTELLDWSLPGLLGRDTGPLPQFAAILFGLAVVAPTRDRLNRWADSRFRKGLTDLRDHLPAALKNLSRVAGSAEIVDEAMTQIAKGLCPLRMAFLIDRSPAMTLNITPTEVKAWQAGRARDASPRDLEIEESDSLFPLRLPLHIRSGGADVPKAWLLLGPRPDGSLYPKDEREALSRIAIPLAQALKAATDREGTIRDLENRLAAIEAAVRRPSQGAAADRKTTGRRRRGTR